MKSDRCLGLEKETYWTRETFGGSKRPDRRDQQQWRSQMAVTHFREHCEPVGLPTIIVEGFRPLDGLPQCQNAGQPLRPRSDFPASSAGLSGTVTIELVQKALCDFQIGRLEALGEPIVDRREQLARLFGPALVAPHPREAGGGA